MLQIKFKKLDDELHFWAGMVIWIFIFILANFIVSQWMSSLVAFLASGSSAVVKEYYDLNVKKTRFDWRDIKFTLLGALIPALIFLFADIIYMLNIIK
jgi:hypothetical protein